MELPLHYRNLTIEQKKTVVANLIAQFWDQKIHGLTDNLSDSQIEFLFAYFFTESKEEREKMWDFVQKKYEATLKEIEVVVKKIQMLNLQHNELLASQEDAEEFSKNLKKNKL